MTDKEMLKYYATYLIYGNKTLEEAALALHISVSSLQKYLKELKKIDIDLYNQVKDRLDVIVTSRKVLGGRKGKRKTGYSLEYINMIADNIIKNFEENGESISIRAIASSCDIPKSTVYDLFNKYLDEERLKKMKDIFEYNRTSLKSNKDTKRR